MSKCSLSPSDSDIQCMNQIETKNKYGKKSTVAQLLATIVQSLMLVNVGMELGMPTLVIGSLYKNNNAEFEISASQSSWYGSILYLCQPIGSLLSGYTQKHYGKKSCTIMACLPSLLGWILLRYAESVPMLYASMLAMGLGLGFADGPAYSYVGEICEPRLRGVMSCIINMACLIGILFSYSLGFVLPWKTVALLNSICPMMCLALVAFIPESPIWLISKGRHGKAMAAICWLRGWVEPSVVAREYQNLMFYYRTSAEQGTNSKGIFSSLRWLKNPSVYRPMRLATVYYMITLISCMTPCRPYIVKLMHDSGVKDTSKIALILFGVMQLVGSVILTLTVSKLGKRLLTIMTLSINTFTILMFGTYMVSVNNDWMKPTAYVPVVLYSVILFSGAMGILTVPWTMISEIYPNEAKGFASSLNTAIFYILTFASTKAYLSVETTLGLNNTFFMLAALSFVGLVYLYRNMPETVNKTFTEIETFFIDENKRFTHLPDNTAA